MATNRDELREDLVATIEAAPELPKGDRQHLADVFLDRLNAEYALLPRATDKGPKRARTASGAPWLPGWLRIALVVAFLLVVVPAVLHVFPIFLILVVVVGLAVRHARSHRSSTVASGLDR